MPKTIPSTLIADEMAGWSGSDNESGGSEDGSE
jgi:hypothetical protein